MSIMMCDVCSRSVDTDWEPTVQVREADKEEERTMCEECLVRKAGTKPSSILTIDGTPAAEWIEQEMGT